MKERINMQTRFATATDDEFNVQVIDYFLEENGYASNKDISRTFITEAEAKKWYDEQVEKHINDVISRYEMNNEEAEDYKKNGIGQYQFPMGEGTGYVIRTTDLNMEWNVVMSHMEPLPLEVQNAHEDEAFSDEEGDEVPNYTLKPSMFKSKTDWNNICKAVRLKPDKIESLTIDFVPDTYETKK